jgi:ribosome-associated toxin RatA of RatAB toxin-antitoxin module
VRLIATFHSINLTMPQVRKSVLVPFPAEAMFALVDRVEDYPRFLPWCGGTRVIERRADALVASIDIAYRGIRRSFATVNANRPPERIDIALREGPFRRLSGSWRFTPLGEEGCRIDFELDYEFASRLVERILGPAFNEIAATFVDAFVRRAEGTATERQ